MEEDQNYLKVKKIILFFLSFLLSLNCFANEIKISKIVELEDPWGSTFINKNACLNVPSIPCPRASKWSLHWPAGPRRSHRAPPYRHPHRPPPTAKTPNWHRSLELMSGVSRPAQEAFRFGVLRPWSLAPCIWDSGDAGVLRGGVGRDFL